MNLKELFEMQKKLDEHITKEKGLEGQNLLPQKILALQVELGELANEWRGFKFWSNNQKPNDKMCHSCKESDADTWRCGNMKACGATFTYPLQHCIICGWDTVIPYKTRNPLLEEYVDCLHFFLSMANTLNLTERELNILDVTLGFDTTYIFAEIIYYTGNILFDENIYHRLMNFRTAFNIYINMGEQRLGFTWEQIVQAYKEKNQVNHQRQQNGY